MTRFTRLLWLGLAMVAIAAMGRGSAAAEPPRVVASIAPIHSLVANVMAGIGEPRLLVRGFASPHAYQLKPSEAADLARAGAVFWVGPDLETVLAKPLAALAGRATVVALGESERLTLWPAREGGAWGDHDDGHDDHGGIDPHVWLAPANAAATVDLIADTLAGLNPDNAAAYRENAARTTARIERLAAAIESTLAPVRDAPYVVLHDAFQYFERSFNLTAIGAISVSPDRPPSARRLSDLRRHMHALEAVCAFSEPQIPAGLVDTLIADSGMKRDVLDPLGATLPPGPDAYFAMMTANADALARCLSTEN